MAIVHLSGTYGSRAISILQWAPAGEDGGIGVVVVPLFISESRLVSIFRSYVSPGVRL